MIKTALDVAFFALMIFWTWIITVSTIGMDGPDFMKILMYINMAFVVGIMAFITYDYMTFRQKIESTTMYGFYCEKFLSREWLWILTGITLVVTIRAVKHIWQHIHATDAFLT